MCHNESNYARNVSSFNDFILIRRTHSNAVKQRKGRLAKNVSKYVQMSNKLKWTFVNLMINIYISFFFRNAFMYMYNRRVAYIEYRKMLA